MTLPLSGAISMSQVLAELQTANPSRTIPVSLMDLDVQQLEGFVITPSGPFSMSDLYGGTAGPAFQSFGGTVSASDISSPYSANATVGLNADGTVFATHTPTGFETVGTAWATGAGLSGVWVLATTTGGSAGSGTVGTWMQLNSSRSWSRNRTTLGTSTWIIRLDFAMSSGGSVVHSQTVTLQAAGEA
jgi:hypothetical protein